MEEKHEGLVLRSIDYKEREKIITLFTPTRGIISLFVKGISRKKNHLLTLTSPFTQGEYHFRIGNSDLYSFQDGTPLNAHLFLREKLSYLTAATQFIQALLTTQLPGKPAPFLYQLVLFYLNALPKFTDPIALISSYLLKVLKHEGVLSLAHREVSYTQEEWVTLITLTEARHIQQLQQTLVSIELHEKIQLTFKKIGES